MSKEKRVPMRKCKVKGCNFTGYTDTGKCWCHSWGMVPPKQYTRQEVLVLPRASYHTFRQARSQSPCHGYCLEKA